MVIGDFTLTAQYFASSCQYSTNSMQFVLDKLDAVCMKFAWSLSVNCHDSQFHRLPFTDKLDAYGR